MQNSQENICVGVTFNKVVAIKRVHHKCFAMTPQNHTTLERRQIIIRMCVHRYFVEHFSELYYRFISKSKGRILDELRVSFNFFTENALFE